MSGKGSGARPFSVDRKTFADNFDAIFGKPKPAAITPERLQAAIEHGAGGDMARPVEARTAPAYGDYTYSIYCPKCGNDWIEHDASQPEPNCPRIIG